MEHAIVYYENYSPVGDLSVLAICFVLIILLLSTFISRTKNFVLFQIMVGLLMLSSFSSICFHVLMNQLDQTPYLVVDILHALYHLALFGILFVYVWYLMEPLQLLRRNDYVFVKIAGLVYVLIILYEVIGLALDYGFYIMENGTVHKGINIFPFVYLFFMGIILFMMIRYHARMFRQVNRAMIATWGVSLMILAIQGRHHQSSFTVLSFLFPIVSVFFLIHANPYDIEIGAVNEKSFADMVEFSYHKKKPMLLVSLYIKDLQGVEKKHPGEFQNVIRSLSERFFRNSVLFQITAAHMIMAVNIKKRGEYKEKLEKLIELFKEETAKYKMDYKLLVIETEETISRDNDYVNLIRYIGREIQDQTVYYVDEEDIRAYQKYKYILKELKDIQKKHDLEDERVKVYCQPVFNLDTGSYDTAEALMRLQLPELGMIFPTQFISLAEQHHYIHTLSKIILHKTCLMIHQLLEEHYEVRRISVNFSVSEVLDPDFCEDIIQIISDSRIPYNKIAVELTESQNEREFLTIKDKIDRLRKNGIKFYLDDFGTGYSNFERIMELPFDIIKFDRSMVAAVTTDEKSEKMVYHLAGMFDEMNYSILYEGVETPQDEEKCVQMYAKYLQGYKYSKPIPIERLTEYFKKAL